MPRYARTKPTAKEAELAQRANEIACAQMKIQSDELVFIGESFIGDIFRDDHIFGLTRRGKVYVVVGQTPREVIRTVAHEIRHRWQFERRKFISAEWRERDARIFEAEFTQTLRGVTIDELLHELLMIKYSTCRQAAPAAHAAKPRVLQPAQPPVRDAPRANAMFATVTERIEYIRKLLSRLPNTPYYKSQRANLATELAERLKE